MKKRFDNDITPCDIYIFTCSMNKVALESNDSIKTDFANVKKFLRSEQTKEKDIDSVILLLKIRNYHDSESITEAKTVLQELYRVIAITWGEYVSCHDRFARIRIKM